MRMRGAPGLLMLCFVSTSYLVASVHSSREKEEKKKEKKRQEESLREYQKGLLSEALTMFHREGTLEDAEDLHRAYLTYRDAEAKYHTKEITATRKRVREAIRAKTKDLVSRAR